MNLFEGQDGSCPPCPFLTTSLSLDWTPLNLDDSIVICRVLIKCYLLSWKWTTLTCFWSDHSRLPGATRGNCFLCTVVQMRVA